MWAFMSQSLIFLVNIFGFCKRKVHINYHLEYPGVLHQRRRPNASLVTAGPSRRRLSMQRAQAAQTSHL